MTNLGVKCLASTLGAIETIYNCNYVFSKITKLKKKIKNVQTNGGLMISSLNGTKIVSSRQLIFTKTNIS